MSHENLHITLQVSLCAAIVLGGIGLLADCLEWKISLAYFFVPFAIAVFIAFAIVLYDM